MVKVAFSLAVLASLLLTPGVYPSADAGAVQAQESAGAGDVGQVTGLPLPRFVTLRASEANMRSGPGLRYPIQWIYRREGLPMEVVAEYDTWRKLRDWEGTEGWMHQSMLSGERAVMVVGADSFILDEPNPNARTVAQLEEGVVATLEACAREWCEISVQGYSGWLPGDAVFGVLPGETVE